LPASSKAVSSRGTSRQRFTLVPRRELERDLVDELHLLLYPVVVGDGLRLFPGRGQTHDLYLVESRSVPSGVTIQTYRPAGRATFGTAG
jgi:dihydrofolate reductase